MPRMYRRPHGTYYIDLDGVRRSLKTKDRAVARKRFQAIKRQWAEGKLAHLTGHCNVTLGQFAAEFDEWSEANQPRATYRANRLALAKLRKVCGDSTKLDRINLRHLDEMVTVERKAGRKTNSINNYIRHARASLNKAVEWGYVTGNPLRQAKELPKGRTQPKYIASIKEISQFLASIEDLDLRRLATAYLATGRRRGEVLGLEWRDVDLQGSTYCVRRAKRHLSGIYPINGAFRAVLESMEPGQGRVFSRWAHPDTVSKVIKKALKAAGLGHLTLHSLRHTFASQQLMNGRSMRVVGELLGHTDSRTTEIYAHLSKDYLAEAAEISLGPVDLGAHNSHNDKASG